MCGRFTQHRPVAELASIFDAEPLAGEVLPRYNLAPTDPALVVVERPGQRAIVSFRWGLVPAWATGPSVGPRAINARAETVASSRLFRESFLRRRCLVPVDGFYEWRPERGGRQPYLIRRRDRLPLALAGLWAAWRDPRTGEPRRTFSIVTTAANAAIAPLHDRMPVVLPAAAWDRWLSPLPADPGELTGLLVPADPEPLEVVPVSRLVNDVRNDGPELIEPLSAPPSSRADRPGRCARRPR